MAVRASRTSSSMNGLMTAITIFMAVPRLVRRAGRFRSGLTARRPLRGHPPDHTNQKLCQRACWLHPSERYDIFDFRGDGRIAPHKGPLKTATVTPAKLADQDSAAKLHRRQAKVRWRWLKAG